MTTAPPFVRASQGGGKMEFKHEGSGSRCVRIWLRIHRPRWAPSGFMGIYAAGVCRGYDSQA